MGKQTEARHSIDTTNDKTNSSFKWARRLQLLDYHRWYYVKKVLANKKHKEERHVVESDSKYLEPFDMSECSRKESIKNAQFEVHTTEPCILAKRFPLPQSPRTKSFPPSSPSNKSSRATRIKKLIAREVSKRSGRHKRSSTCPNESELVSTSSTHPQIESKSEGVFSESEVAQTLLHRQHSTDEGKKKCRLCNTMKIACHLGDKKEVCTGGELQLDHINMLLQELPDEAINQLHLCENTRGSASVQQSRELLDAMDVLSMNKKFFLRVLDDPRSSLRNNFLAQQATMSNKRKSFKKSGTFPICEPSSTQDTSFDANMSKQKLSRNKSSNAHTMLEKLSTFHDNHVPRKRFKDIRQKIKHVIKESRQDRHVLAMDAVLHKVPYGQKVPEESTKNTPCIGTCETEVYVSPNRNNHAKNHDRRSSSLDGSLNRYCQLFETTSFGREDKINIPERLRLRVMDEYASSAAQKKLGRIFSSPDLQISLSNQHEDLVHKTPNKWMSFKETVQDISKMNMEHENSFDGHEEIKREVDLSTKEAPSSIYNGSNSTEDQSEIIGDNTTLEENSSDSDGGATATQSTYMQSDESTRTSLNEFDTHMFVPSIKDTTLKDTNSIEQLTYSPSQESSTESPTFACSKIDDDGIEISFDSISSCLPHGQYSNDNKEEFNYVRDILKLSGYLSTQLLGTWYSSNQPVDPSIFVELESCSLHEPHCSPSKEGMHDSHLLLFDLINEILMHIYERSESYWPAPLSSRSRTHRMPKGYRVLDEVWASINWYMSCSNPEVCPSLDFISMRDLTRDDGWMNLQFDVECVGLEVEDLIFKELIRELTS